MGISELSVRHSDMVHSHVSLQFWRRSNLPFVRTLATIPSVVSVTELLMWQWTGACSFIKLAQASFTTCTISFASKLDGLRWRVPSLAGLLGAQRHRARTAQSLRSGASYADR